MFLHNNQVDFKTCSDSVYIFSCVLYLNYGVITGNHTGHWTLHVSSSHDRRAPLPFIDSVEVKMLQMVTDKLVLVSFIMFTFSGIIS